MSAIEAEFGRTSRCPALGCRRRSLLDNRAIGPKLAISTACSARLGGKKGMMTTAEVQPDYREWVSAETGEADRRMFIDQSVFELEMERIFYRAWNFVAHESQIPNPGDFFQNFIGETNVIVVRDNAGDVQVLV